MIMSFGFHYYETTSQSLTLQYFDKKTSPIVFSTQHSYAAVVLPVIGGMLWMVDYKIPFIAGAFFSLISLCLVQMIRTEVTNDQ